MGSFINIDLKNFFNHKLIGCDYNIKNNESLENKGICNFYLKPELLPNSNERIFVNKTPFIFPDKSDDVYDNFTCEEQFISFPQGYYTHIHMLGLSEWGDFEDIIKILLDDEEKGECKIFFLDWSRKFSSDGKMIRFDFDNKYDNSCFPAFKSVISNYDTQSIFYNNCSLINNSKEINSIILPYNPNMHIFAITLSNQL